MQIHVDHTRLYDRNHILHIDLEDPVHMFFHCKRNTAFGWQGTTGKSATRTARGDDNAVMVAVNQNAADILFIAWENNCIGFKPGTGGIVAVGDHMGFVAVNILFAYKVFQCFDMFCFKH